ncbi:Mpo1-like protein [Aeromonas veronii]|nr:DUF962 domain-containing protein [Aeromonas veronii]
MKGIQEWFEEYGQSHRHPVNVAIHKLAVPGIYLCSLALLWIAQFVGHKIEGKRPSFLADLQFLLIGPAWVLASLYRRLGIPY